MNENHLLTRAILLLPLLATAFMPAAIAQRGGEVINLPSQFQGTPFSQIRLPEMLNNPIVPTDVTGPGGGLGHARGLRNEILGPQARTVIPDVRGIPGDARYAFNRQWLPIGTATVASLPSTANLIANGLAASDTAVRSSIIFATPGTGAIMPTVTAQYSTVSGNEIAVTSGAVLVKPLDQSIVVSNTIGGSKVSIRVAKGALALIAALDNQLTVTNLIGDRSSDVHLFTPSANGRLFELPIPQGTQTVITLNGAAPSPEAGMIAAQRRNQAVREQLPTGLCLNSFEFDYTKAMKRYGMIRALPESDLKRLLHVAAAVTVVRYGG